jgi:hypothetical protein
VIVFPPGSSHSDKVGDRRCLAGSPGWSSASRIAAHGPGSSARLIDPRLRRDGSGILGEAWACDASKFDASHEPTLACVGYSECDLFLPEIFRGWDAITRKHLRTLYSIPNRDMQRSPWRAGAKNEEIKFGQYP